MRSVVQTVGVAIALVCAIGCGGAPSALDSCKHFCDKQGSCANATSDQINACKQGCDSNKNMYADDDQQISDRCANPDQVRSEVYDCFGNYCDSTLATQCAGAVVCKAK